MLQDIINSDEPVQDEVVTENTDIPYGYMEMDNTDLDLVETTSLDGALVELSGNYKDSAIYTVIPMIDGLCYQWNTIFIDDCLTAMATDRLNQFDSNELDAWYNFVNFQDYHTTSALTTDANGTAIGATNPNEENESYTVGENGLIYDGIQNSPGAKEFAQPPSYEVQNEDVWRSLDLAFMSLYNCEEINDCSNNDEYEETVPCLIT